MVREFMDIEILQSTQDFGMLIGKGGFGYVYRGVYHGTDVAVKRFNKDGDNDWATLPREVANLTRFQHPNLICLMGFCTSPPCLVYPLMPNLSLYHCLHEFKVRKPLMWEVRVNVMIGTAKGLAYLHSSKPTFVHQDVKSHNILLDEGFNPKVADFGFVTPLPQNVGSTSVITAAGTVRLAGTRGYLAPEFA